MAYNASLGEQFEVIQRWLSGGNSSGSYSGQSDPFVGLAEPGRRRYFRFEHDFEQASEHKERTIRMRLDGSDRLHDEPRPFVRLEWGAYLFAPSKNALAILQSRTAAQDATRSVAWSAEKGETEIRRLREIENRQGDAAAVSAWKSALEDPDAAVDFTTASIWAAIREYHGGVLRTPFAVLVAERSLVDEVLLDPERNLSVEGYLPRMAESFGEIYLGLDAGGDGTYERESTACNHAIMALDPESAFNKARESTQLALQALVDEAVRYARFDEETSWTLTLDARELVEPLLADFCEEWFGLSEEKKYLKRGGYRWDWQGKPPTYPGHFLAPSRYFFQPHPFSLVKEIGTAQGVALRSAMLKFLQSQGTLIKAPVARAILDSELGKKDPDFAARTLVGAVVGFVPTVNGNILRILNEWLREGTLWSLRARLAGSKAAHFLDACNRLGADFIPAMQLRTAPEVIWRTAKVAHTLGVGADQVDVHPGDLVVAAAISATQQNLQQGRADLHHAFGGNRRADSHPTHACPGKDPALAVMLGFFSALVESTLPLRAGPGPLTLAADGQLPRTHAPGSDQSILFSLQDIGDLAPMHGHAHAFQIKADNLLMQVATTPLATIGDSWLFDFGNAQSSLISSLLKKGYGVNPDYHFNSWGARLEDMANATSLGILKNHFTQPQPGLAKPRAIIFGGGGNDVVYRYTDPPATPLYKLLRDLPKEKEEDALIEEEVKKFIDQKLGGFYGTIIDFILDDLKDVTDVPILIHAYDHPIPDGRALLFFPWLKPTFVAKGYDIPDFPKKSADLTAATKVMKCLINRLNLVVNNLVKTYEKTHPGRVHHVNLTGTLAKNYGTPDQYADLWENELHPGKKKLAPGEPGPAQDGFDLLAEVIAAKLEKDLGILPFTP